MLNRNDRFEPAPHVTWTMLDDTEAILLDLKTKHYYSLNETGRFIWERLLQQERLGDIAVSLASVYTVETEDALDRVYQLVEHLKKENLVRIK